MSRITRRVALVTTIALVLAVPVFLISSNVRWAANSLRMYGFLFDRHQVAQGTGISRDELLRGSRQIVDYFNSDQEPLRVVVQLAGAERELFGPREVQHMADVKGLFRGVYRVQEASGALLVAGTALLLAIHRRRGLKVVGKLAAMGGALTVALVVVVGLGSLVSFGPLFYLFHIVSFSNDLWQLERTDYLLRLFPQGFWQDATLLIGAATLVEALALIAVAYGGLRWVRRATHRRRVAQRATG
ncbi:MAG: TIGR01906 family membrane protein [Chloroflexi bacterium]|nr:TIGR01906 family membrane protein [Chloroflexota bacterium]